MVLIKLKYFFCKYGNQHTRNCHYNMKRESKHNLYTGGTIRYIGNMKYCTKGLVEIYRRGKLYTYKNNNLQHCVKCGGSKFSCKAIPHETNQYGNKIWIPRKIKKAFITEI